MPSTDRERRRGRNARSRISGEYLCPVGMAPSSHNQGPPPKPGALHGDFRVAIDGDFHMAKDIIGQEIRLPVAKEKAFYY